ncbi:hypothetical protein MMC18_001396 [Xylographa bjoerkii]|nr:hypothetical protein [Xylographa bjoerkii]
MDNLELLRRQYLQLIEPECLALPSLDSIRLPQVQAYLYETMFREGSLHYSPPDRYKIRVLKKLIEIMESAIIDPDEDEISDDLAACLAQLMSTPQIPVTIAALQKNYVTYTMPTTSPNAATISTLEARALLASSGTTGLRTWEAALHLGTYLSAAGGSLLVKGKTIIELGAGTGFLSILCAKHLGAKYVLSTDGSGEVVDDMVSNVYFNGLEGSGVIDPALLKWGHVLTDELFESSCGIRRFDIALGADIVRAHSS